MLNVLGRWSLHPAAWWQFWYPQSGAFGGAILLVLGWLFLCVQFAFAFGPIPKADQCISVYALLNRNCAPAYMCNGPKGTNADWCCSTTQRWLTEEQKLLRWYKKNCRADG